MPTLEIDHSIQSSQDAKLSNICLHVALDGDECASGELYVDDGSTFDYKKGHFARKRIQFTKTTLNWSSGDDDKYNVINMITKMVIMGSKAEFKSAYIIEEAVETKKRVRLSKVTDGYIVECEARANKNWRILLE